MLIFRNPGLIDETALTTQGISVKVGDSPIGMFGTGMKVAIAVTLRLGGQVEVWRGRKRLEFGLDEKTVRGEKFRIVTMNGKRLGFTDQFGAHWEPWMAYREFWSNCRDEGGDILSTTEQPEIRARETQVVVRCAALEKVHEGRGDVVLTSAPLATLPGLEIHSGRSKYVFYRGIRVAETPSKRESLYTYNLTSAQTLTEDRTLKYTWALPTELAGAIVQCSDASIITEVLTADTDHLEAHLPWADVRDQTPSPQFMHTAEHLYRNNKLRGSAIKLFKEYLDTIPGYDSPYLVQPSDAQEAILTRALRMTEDVGVRIPRQMIQFKESRSYVGVKQEGGFIVAPAELLNETSTVIAATLLKWYATEYYAGALSLAARILTGKWPVEDRKGQEKEYQEMAPEYAF